MVCLLDGMSQIDDSVHSGAVSVFLAGYVVVQVHALVSKVIVSSKL